MVTRGDHEKKTNDTLSRISLERVTYTWHVR